MLEKKISQVVAKNKKLYEDLFNNISMDLIHLYGNTNYSRSDYYEYGRLLNLLTKINEELIKIGVEQKKELLSQMNEIYEDIRRGSGLNTVNTFVELPNLDCVWCPDGKTFSQRIWANNQELNDRLVNGLTDIIVGRTDKDEIITSLLDLCNETGDRAVWRATALVTTELCYARARATLDDYIAGGIKEYVFHNTMDNKTCEDCAELNGKVFKVSEAEIGKNFPPVHTNCRG